MERDFKKREETIDDKIIIIQKKIKDFKDNNTEFKKYLKSQVNANLDELKKKLEKTEFEPKERELIKKYSKLYERYLSTFKRIFEEDKENQKYIPLDYENLLNELNTDLTNLKNKNPNNSNDNNRNIIGNQNRNSKEDMVIKKSNILLLESIKSFINLLITLIKKIKNLAKKLTEGSNIISGESSTNENQKDKPNKDLNIISGESSSSESQKDKPTKGLNIISGESSSSEKQKDKPTIKEIFVDNYRNKCELFGEIKDIFSKIEEVESKGKKLTLIMEKKIIDKQKTLKKKDIGLDEIKKVNDDYSNLIKQILEIGKKFQNEYDSIKKDEKVIRIDVLIIFDVTSSMEEYLNKFINEFNNIIDEFKKRCPTALIYFGFIGYRDINDIELGDDYIDIDFTVNYNYLNNEIQKIEADGGDDIPEDIAGAFEMALNKKWRGDIRASLLITDSPCHGVEFHNGNEIEDKYSDDKDIKEMIHQFEEKKISLICFNLCKNTDKMFEIFEKEYNSRKKNNTNFFTIIKNFNDYSFIKEIGELYDSNFKKYVDKIEKEKEQKKLNA